MIDTQALQQALIERLKPLDLHRVILFGSYAYGAPTEDSDIDLYVVTKDEFIPQSFREKSDLTKSVSKQLRDLRSSLAIDLIVHTKSMNGKFIELNSSFYREISEKGLTLL